MHSYAYTRRSFEGFYRKSDRLKYGLSNKDAYDNHVRILCDRINSLGFPYRFKIIQKKSRKLCSPADFETALLTRKVNSDLQRLVGSNGPARASVVKEIRRICVESVPYTIIRLDIKRFYDSIDVDDMIRVVNHATRQTYSLRRNLEEFLRWSEGNFGGIPTGLSLTASLAEFYISQEFDSKVRALKGVNFYIRYVDDIIMICAPGRSGEDYISDVEKLLPPGLSFNTSTEKRKCINLLSDKAEGSFEYLGYTFFIGSMSKGSDDGRDVIVDIAQSKVNRRKTRFVKALLQFLKDGSEGDLRRRHLLINSGYTFFDSSAGRSMSAGLCNTYSEIDFPSSALLQLQRFYSYCLLSDKFSLSARLKMSHLSGAAKRSMVALNTNKHVEKRVHISFSEAELARLTRCWKDG